MSTQPLLFDGVWRPEQPVRGKWCVVRYWKAGEASYRQIGYQLGTNAVVFSVKKQAQQVAGELNKRDGYA